MDLYLHKVVHPEAHENYRVLLNDDGLKVEIRLDRHSARCANSRRVCEVHPERSPPDRTKLLQTKRKGSQ
jgi:hypothetical protein